MQNNLTTHLQRELRSDHAGETGAIYICKGIVAAVETFVDQHNLGVLLQAWCWELGFGFSLGCGTCTPCLSTTCNATKN
jgi:demethoxyubiquinone hydroxylase (CLK1/Coq7/Cat5 family)